MNYTENKIDDILCNVGRYLVHKDANRLADEIRFTLKEIQKDVRHKCAENIVQMQGTGDGYTVLKDTAHSVIMNTSLE